MISHLVHGNGMKSAQLIIEILLRHRISHLDKLNNGILLWKHLFLHQKLCVEQMGILIF